MYTLVIVLSLLLTAFFTGMEYALASANKLAFELEKKQGKKSGFIISRLLENPGRILGVCLIGFQIFLVCYGLLAGELLIPVWEWAGVDRFDPTGTVRQLLEIAFSSLLILAVSFLFRGIFRAKNDSLLRFFAPVLDFFFSILEPVSRFFSGIANWMLEYLFNTPVDEKRQVFSRVDLEHYYFRNRETEEEHSELNQELFENALSLPGTRIRHCLVPRMEIEGVDINTAVDEVVQKMVQTKLSKLVVYDGNIDNIVGYVHQLDMFGAPSSLKEMVLPIPAIPETMSVSALINRLNQIGRSMAWVVDEFGGTAGIVTMEDLLEEIFGEMYDEYDTGKLVEQQLGEQEYRFSGRLETDYLREKYGLDFNGSDAETVSGYVISRHPVFPREGDVIILGNYQFEILNMEPTRIDQLKLKILA